MTWNTYSAILLILIAATVCVVAPGTRLKSKSRSSSSRSVSTDICSSGCGTPLKSKTRQSIQSRLDDNGVSFEDCKDKCMETIKGGKRKKCGCYCSIFHDPCPSTGKRGTSSTTNPQDLSTSTDTVKLSDDTNTCLQEALTSGRGRSGFSPRTIQLLKLNGINIDPENCQEQCEGLLQDFSDKTRVRSGTRRRQERQCSRFCSRYRVCLQKQATDDTKNCLQVALVNGRGRSGFSPKTVQQLLKLIDNDINIDPENCQEQCEGLLQNLSDKTRIRSGTRRRQERQCSRFCYRYRACLQKQATESPTTQRITTEASTSQSTITMTETPETETTVTFTTPSTTEETQTTTATAAQPTTDQPTIATDTGDATTAMVIELPETVPEPTTTTAVLPSTTSVVMPTPTPTPMVTDMVTTTEVTTTEATTTEVTTTEATTTEATTTEATTTEATTTEATTTEATTTEGVTMMP